MAKQSEKVDDLSVPLEEERCKEFSEGNTCATQRDEGESHKEEIRQPQWAYGGQSSEKTVMDIGSTTVEQEEIVDDLQNIVPECKEAFDTGGVAGLNEFLKCKLSQWKKIPVNIAVVGISGSGKSSFINAMRDLKSTDSEAAKTGHTETTFEISRYVHPKQTNLSFWDLPGVGTPSFQEEFYEQNMNDWLKRMNSGVQDMSEFDVFIIVTSDRFTEHDIWLSKIITTKYQKIFYLVRTQVDVAFYRELRSCQEGPRRSNDEIMEIIRAYCKKNLMAVGCSDAPIFLIDNYDTKAHDFDKLKQCLFRDVPESKREALAFTLSSSSEDMIEIKKSLILRRLYLSAFKCSSLTKALVTETIFIKEQFGVTGEKLTEYANLPDIFPLDSQRIKCTDEWMKDYYSSHRSYASCVVGAAAAFSLANTKKLWIVGLGVPAMLEWWTAYKVLKEIVNMCANDARKIQRAILKIQHTSAAI